MKRKSNKTDSVWEFSGYGVVSIYDDEEPRLTYPDNGVDCYKKIGAFPIPVFGLRKDAEKFKAWVKKGAPYQKHRVVKVAVVMNSSFTDKEIRELKEQVK